MHSCNVMEEES